MAQVDMSSDPSSSRSPNTIITRLEFHVTPMTKNNKIEIYLSISILLFELFILLK